MPSTSASTTRRVRPDRRARGRVRAGPPLRPGLGRVAERRRTGPGSSTPGDTGPNPELAERASGADLLVCEATLETRGRGRSRVARPPLARRGDRPRRRGPGRPAPDHPLSVGATGADARPAGDGSTPRSGWPDRVSSSRCRRSRTVGRPAARRARAPQAPARTPRWRPHAPGGRTSTTRRSTGPAPRCGRRRRSSALPRSWPAPSARRRPVPARAGPRPGSRRRPPGGR